MDFGRGKRLWVAAVFLRTAVPEAASACQPNFKRMLRKLKRRHEFLSVARMGKKFVTPGLVLQAWKRPLTLQDGAHEAIGEDVRVGYTVTKKVGNAVVRNRTKRRLRALAKEIIPNYVSGAFDLVLIGRAETRNRTFGDLKIDLIKGLSCLETRRNSSVET
jgi:ribonuclease P protein component